MFFSVIATSQGIIGFPWTLFSSKQKELSIQSSFLMVEIFFVCVCENVSDTCYVEIVLCHIILKIHILFSDCFALSFLVDNCVMLTRVPRPHGLELLVIVLLLLSK